MNDLLNQINQQNQAANSQISPLTLIIGLPFLLLLILLIYHRKTPGQRKKGLVELAELVGGVLGVVCVRLFLLNPIEEIGFSMVVNNPTRISSGDINTILHSTTFWKCVIGFLVGAIAGRFGVKAYLKQTAAQSAASVAAQVPPSYTPTPSRSPSAESRLAELQVLKEKGLISAEDYEKKKADIIHNL
jgi:drug/metabolite transporter (DMT)-like permease